MSTWTKGVISAEVDTFPVPKAPRGHAVGVQGGVGGMQGEWGAQEGVQRRGWTPNFGLVKRDPRRALNNTIS